MGAAKRCLPGMGFAASGALLEGWALLGLGEQFCALDDWGWCGAVLPAPAHRQRLFPKNN